MESAQQLTQQTFGAFFSENDPLEREIFINCVDCKQEFVTPENSNCVLLQKCISCIDKLSCIGVAVSSDGVAAGDCNSVPNEPAEVAAAAVEVAATEVTLPSKTEPSMEEILFARKMRSELECLCSYIGCFNTWSDHCHFSSNCTTYGGFCEGHVMHDMHSPETLKSFQSGQDFCRAKCWRTDIEAEEAIYANDATSRLLTGAPSRLPPRALFQQCLKGFVDGDGHTIDDSSSKEQQPVIPDSSFSLSRTATEQSVQAVASTTPMAATAAGRRGGRRGGVSDKPILLVVQRQQELGAILLRETVVKEKDFKGDLIDIAVVQVHFGHDPAAAVPRTYKYDVASGGLVTTFILHDCPFKMPLLFHFNRLQARVSKLDKRGWAFPCYLRLSPSAATDGVVVPFAGKTIIGVELWRTRCQSARMDLIVLNIEDMQFERIPDCLPFLKHHYTDVSIDFDTESNPHPQFTTSYIAEHYHAWTKSGGWFYRRELGIHPNSPNPLKPAAFNSVNAKFTLETVTFNQRGEAVHLIGTTDGRVRRPPTRLTMDPPATSTTPSKSAAAAAKKRNGSAVNSLDATGASANESESAAGGGEAVKRARKAAPAIANRKGSATVGGATTRRSPRRLKPDDEEDDDDETEVEGTVAPLPSRAGGSGKNGMTKGRNKKNQSDADLSAIDFYADDSYIMMEESVTDKGKGGEAQLSQQSGVRRGASESGNADAAAATTALAGVVRELMTQVENLSADVRDLRSGGPGPARVPPAAQPSPRNAAATGGGSSMFEAFQAASAQGGGSGSNRDVVNLYRSQIVRENLQNAHHIRERMLAQSENEFQQLLAFMVQNNK